MKNKHQKRFSLLILSIISLLIVHPAVGDTEDHNTLVIQIQSAEEVWPARYWPIHSQWQGFLIRRSPGESAFWFPDAIKEISWNRTKYTFVLRDGLTFHDGTAVTARDVLYSFAVGRLFWDKSYVKASNLTIGEARAMVDVYYNVQFASDDPNGEGLEFTLGPGDAFPNPSFLFDFLAYRPYVCILVPEGSHGSYEDNHSTCQRKIEEFRRNPISCGPYRVVDLQAQKPFLFERFDDWYGWGKSFIDDHGLEVTFPSVQDAFNYLKFVPTDNATQALNKLQSGELDIVTDLGRSYESLADFNELNLPETLINYTMENLVSWNLHLNVQGDWPQVFNGTGNYPLTELWFRQVLCHAINRTNIVKNVFYGIAGERTDFYPQWLLKDYPGVDTSDYYTFDTNHLKAIQLLEEHGYHKLGFKDDPDNRFGHGHYLNETQDQDSGHIFKMVVENSTSYKKALGMAVAKDLEQVGIFVKTEFRPRDLFLAELVNNFRPGWTYNRSYEVLGEKDPKWFGPSWDFIVSGEGYHCENLDWWCFPISFACWFYYGGRTGVYNKEYEVSYANMSGGRGYLDYLHEYVPGEFPYPNWHPSDKQHVEAAEKCGQLFTNEMISYIPMIWDQNYYIQDIRLKNLKIPRDGNFFFAPCYWDESALPSSHSDVPGFEILPILALMGIIALMSVIWLIYQKSSKLR